MQKCICLDLTKNASGVESRGERVYIKIVRWNLDIADVHRKFLAATIEAEHDPENDIQSVSDELQKIDAEWGVRRGIAEIGEAKRPLLTIDE